MTHLKKYWLAYLIVIALLLVTVLDSNGIRQDLKDSKAENKTLQEQIDSLSVEYKLLSNKKQKEVVNYIKIKELIKQKEDETNNAIINVYSMDEQQLDARIRTYKHPKRN